MTLNPKAPRETQKKKKNMNTAPLKRSFFFRTTAQLLLLQTPKGSNVTSRPFLGPFWTAAWPSQSAEPTERMAAMDPTLNETTLSHPSDCEEVAARLRQDNLTARLSASVVQLADAMAISRTASKEQIRELLPRGPESQAQHWSRKRRDP